MLRDLFTRRSPSERGVTIVALIPEFPFVLILMTGAARDARRFNRKLVVTLRAFHVLMLADENVTGALMLERNILLERLPGFCRVAVHARDVECFMWG